MASSSDISRIMTVGEVADYLTATARTIYRLAVAKERPAFKLGGRRPFSRADIVRWIQQQSLIESGDAKDEYRSETFLVLKNDEIRQCGEYRAHRLVLEAWARLACGSLA